MANRSIPLAQVRVANPCPKDWAGMTGDDQKRFCSHCSKHVHDISSITQAEFDDLVCKNAGQLCVRYAADAQGRPISLNYARPMIARRNWRRFIPVAILSIIAAGCASFIRKPPPPMQMVAGMMIAPPMMPANSGNAQ